MKKTINTMLIILVTCIFISSHNLHAEIQTIEKGNLVIENIPEIPQKIIDRIFQYNSTRSVDLKDWTADGKGMIISTRFGNTVQLHLIEEPGGAREQITFFPETVNYAYVSPSLELNGFLFLKDIGGKGTYQIYYYDFENGEYTLLTDGSSFNAFVKWSNEGEKFVFSRKDLNNEKCIIYLIDKENTEKKHKIFEKTGWWVTLDWSPDDKKLLLMNRISANESYCYILDIASGKLTQINPSKETIGYKIEGCLWSKNKDGLYITSDENSEFLQLKYYDLSNKQFTTLTSEIPWDVAQIAQSRQGDKLAFVTNENGLSKLYLLDTKTNKYEQVLNIPISKIYSLRFDPDGNRLAFITNSPKTPGDLFVMDLKDNSIERWTHSEVGGLNTETFIEPKLIEYKTFDLVNGKPRMIPAFYYKPLKGDRPFPVLIEIHGGPGAQVSPSFNPMFQYLLNELGIAIIAPNVRGSAGYGKNYLKLDDGYKREDSVKDIGGLLDWIEKQPELDASRIAVSGTSYGGYMVLASMVHYNNRLKCGIDNVGISNFVSYLENQSEYRRDLRRVEYGDERDPEMRKFLTAISPLTSVQQITKPMFIIQGLNDPYVPKEESEKIVSAIRKNEGTVWYLLAKDEGHGFRKKSNIDYYKYSVSYFLENYLLQ